MHTILAAVLALALLIQPSAPPAENPDAGFCEWLDLVDTHWDVLASFSEYVAYDTLAYPLGIAQYVNERLITADCDY